MRLRTIILSSLCLTVTSAHLPAIVINGVNWSNAYQPNETTNDNFPNIAAGVTGGAWTLGTASGIVSITDDYFTIATTTQASNQYYSNSDNWSGSTGMTVEARIQMSTSLSAGAPIGQIRLGGTSALSTNKYIYISFTQDSIYYGTGSTMVTIASGLSLSDFTTIRLTLSDNLANSNASALNIYINDSPIPIGTLSGAAFTSGAAGTNNIIFGDITGTGVAAAGGTSNWNYIAYTQGIIPVPEPGSVILITLGSLTLFIIRRSRTQRLISARDSLLPRR